MNLHANFKEHMGQKSIVRFWWVSGLSSVSWYHLTTLCRPFTHYACLRLCFAIVHIIQTNCIVFILSALADQRNFRQNVHLENMNITSQTTHAKYEWHHTTLNETTGPWKFSAYATELLSINMEATEVNWTQDYRALNCLL